MIYHTRGEPANHYYYNAVSLETEPQGEPANHYYSNAVSIETEILKYTLEICLQ
jgi:hypothetical protein